MIDWGLIGNMKQPVGGVVAQLPAQQSSGNSLAGGLMEGILQGQQAASNVQSLKINDQKLKMGDMVLQDAQQTQQDAQTMRQAAAQGEEAYIKTGEKLFGPSFKYEITTKKLAVEKATADIAGVRADNKIKVPQVIQAYKTALGRLGVSVQDSYLKGGDKEAQKTFNILIDQIDPIDRNVLKQNGLDTYSQSTVGSFKLIGQQALIDQQEEEDKKNATPLKKAQLERDNAKNDLAKDPNNKDFQQAYKEADARVQTAAQGPKMTESPIDKINVAASSNIMKQSHEQAQKNLPIISNLEVFKQQLQNFTPGKFAQTDIAVKSTMQGIAAVLGKPDMFKTNAGVGENMESISNQLKLQLASEIKNARMNQSMFKALSAIPPDVEKTPQGAALITDRLLYIKKSQNAFTDFADQYIQANNGNPTGLEKQWNNFLQAAPLINKDGSLNTQHLQEDYTPFFDPKYKAPIVQPEEVKSSNSQYMLNGQSFNMQQALKDHPGMTEAQIVKEAGLK